MRRPILLAVALLAWPTLGHAEVVQKEGVRVSVAGKLSPSALPRHGTAPVAVSIDGHISSTSRQVGPPQLRKLTIAINSHGKLSTQSVPRCRLGRIRPSTTVEALAACRPALIGEGRFSAHVAYPEQSPFPSRGKLLAFNGRLRGKPVIFAHIYGTEPVPTSYVLPFAISKTRGTFGTVLRASVPQATGKWGYVTGVSLRLDGGSARHGQSYLSAGCPAPAGLPGVVFPLVKTSFSFVGGLNLESTLSRSCRVKS